MTTPQTTPELLACPFCNHSIMHIRPVGQMQQAHCDGCGAAGPLFSEARPAIETWNIRARVTAAPQEGVSEAKLINTAPARIYLVVGEDVADDTHFDDLFDSDVTWCADKIDANSIAYVRADLAPESPQPLAPPPGWKPVPLEPTEAMEIFVHRQAWKNAVAAAPQPPASAPPDTGNVGARKSPHDVVETAIDAAVVSLRESGHRIHRPVVVKAVTAFLDVWEPK